MSRLAITSASFDSTASRLITTSDDGKAIVWEWLVRDPTDLLTVEPLGEPGQSFLALVVNIADECRVFFLNRPQADRFTVAKAEQQAVKVLDRRGHGLTAGTWK